MKQATALIAAVSAACLAGPALAQSDMTENPAATATLANSDGQNVGEVKVFEAAVYAGPNEGNIHPGSHDILDAGDGVGHMRAAYLRL